QARPAVGRAAPARRPGPRAGAPAQAATARRAAGRARQAPARAHPVPAGEHPGKGRHHLHHGHPRPGRGDDDVLAHRGDGGRAHRAGVHAGGAVRIPGHALRRRVHRRHQPVRRTRALARPRRRAGAGAVRRAGRAGTGAAYRLHARRYRGERGRAAREDRRARAAARCRQRRRGQGPRHRLSRRRVDLPRADRVRRGDPGAGDPRRAQFRAALRLGRHAVAELAGNRRGGSGLVNARRDEGTWSFWADVVRNLFGFFRVVRDEFRTRRGRLLVKLIPMLWLGLFFAVPFLIVARISFAEAVFGQVPPYTALLEQAGNGAMSLRVHISSYALLLQDPLYVAAYLRSLLFAGVSTLFCLLIGYPMAYGIARAKPVTRLLLMMLVILPFWTSSLLRTYAMIGIFKTNGWLSSALAAIGVLEPGEAVLHSNLAVYIGIVYNYLPFM